MRKNIKVLCRGYQKKHIPRLDKNFVSHIVTFCTIHDHIYWPQLRFMFVKLSLTRRQICFSFKTRKWTGDPLIDTQEKAITSSLVILATVSLPGVPHSTKMRVRWSMSGQHIMLRSALSQVTEQRICWLYGCEFFSFCDELLCSDTYQGTIHFKSILSI